MWKVRAFPVTVDEKNEGAKKFLLGVTAPPPDGLASLRRLSGLKRFHGRLTLPLESKSDAPRSQKFERPGCGILTTQRPWPRPAIRLSLAFRILERGFLSHGLVLWLSDALVCPLGGEGAVALRSPRHARR